MGMTCRGRSTLYPVRSRATLAVGTITASVRESTLREKDSTTLRPMVRLGE